MANSRSNPRLAMAPPSPPGFQSPPKARERIENGRLKPNLELYEANHFLSRERSHRQLKLHIREMFAAISKQLATVNFQVQNLIPHLIPFWFFRAKSIKSKPKDSGKIESPESRKSSMKSFRKPLLHPFELRGFFDFE